MLVVHASSKKNDVGDSRLVKQNRRQTVAQLTTQYNAGPSASVSEHTVQQTMLDMGVCSRRPTRVHLLTKRHRQLRLQWVRNIETGPWMRSLNPDFSFITSMVVSRYVVCQQDNAPCHKARILLEWFEEHTDEFHLMFWPTNPPDLNPIEHIWDVMERQLRAQTPPWPNISTLRDRCLDIWYNLSPVMYQKLVAPMPSRVAAVLKAKGGATRY
ncbi:hypothetical protein AVEN_48449-1 [Araneus ventricosus]|uniref:Tc1-like transposase DDE domain-containing protein n=1 Tax=Araneus ventricosus TaxID=182803 RepID=A0A4Y2SBU1_ARAVE|nr:hypothetical protein AVEN_48449-1 [Araneus ventricosus]